MKAGRSNEPLAANTLTVRLTWSRIPCERVQEVTIVLNLVAMYIRVHAQHPWECRRTGGRIGPRNKNRRPGSSTATGTFGGRCGIRSEVVQCQPLSVGENGF